MAVGRAAFTTNPLHIGQLALAVGGFVTEGTYATTSAEVYNAARGTWFTTTGMRTARGAHAATVLVKKEVLVEGGTNALGVTASAEVFRY
jgi:hypothetical protein